MKCSRTNCQKQLTGDRYHIYNEPSTAKGYREYCMNCGYRIMDLAANRTMRSEVVDKNGNLIRKIS